MLINPYAFSGGGGGGGGATMTFLQSADDPANLTTYTFASKNFGAAASNRWIIATLCARSGTSGLSVSSVTIGGVSASIVLQATNMGDVVAIAIANVPTGSTGDVVVTYSGGMVRAGHALYRVIGTPTLHDSDSSTATAPAVSLDVPIGFAVGVAMTATNGSVPTWTGLSDVNSTRSVESLITITDASQTFASPETGRALQVAWSTNSQPVGVFASWS